MDIARFRKKPVLGILRGVKSDRINGLVDTVIASGLETLEITMNTEGALSLIKTAVSQSSGRLTIGAGTVLTMDELHGALDAGATFIVMPTLVSDVVEYCAGHNIPVFPGALSPKEIYDSWRAGATMVKVFPAKVLGPDYFREIKGPFNKVELLACGGVTPENMKDYFQCGASAVTFGASVFRKEWLEAGDFKSIGRRVADYITNLPR